MHFDAANVVFYLLQATSSYGTISIAQCLHFLLFSESLNAVQGAAYRLIA